MSTNAFIINCNFYGNLFKKTRTFKSLMVIHAFCGCCICMIHAFCGCCICISKSFSIITKFSSNLTPEPKNNSFNLPSEITMYLPAVGAEFLAPVLWMLFFTISMNSASTPWTRPSKLCESQIFTLLVYSPPCPRPPCPRPPCPLEKKKEEETKSRVRSAPNGSDKHVKYWAMSKELKF